MSLTWADAKNDLSGMLHGTTTGNVTNLTGLAWRAARSVIGRIDPLTTLRRTNLPSAVFDDVYDYTLPSDFKKLADLRPQVNRDLTTNFGSVNLRHFDINKAVRDQLVSVISEGGTKKIRITADVDSETSVIDTVNGISDNGTWAVGGDVSNLTEDNQFFITGNASLNFDLDDNSGVATSGHVENSTLTAVDLTDHDEVATVFAWVFIPDTDNITSFNLRWGSDGSNYWNRTVTSQFDSSSFRDGWNLLSFAWNGATETGTVDPSSITYLRFTVNYPGNAETDIRLDKVFSSIGFIWEVVYYSEFLFRTSGGTWQQKPSADDDVINLDEEAYNIWLFEMGKLAANQIQGEDSSFDINFYTQELEGENGLYRKYKKNNPSQGVKQRSIYYPIN